MNQRVVLDTDAYSQLLRGDERVLDVLAEAQRVYLPVTVLGRWVKIDAEKNRARRPLCS